MYFPILRGKQFELLALREFSEEFGDSEFISPVIEPVKQPYKTLETACEYLTSSDFNFTLTINPDVGDYQLPGDLLGSIVRTTCLDGYQNFQIGVHCKSKQTTLDILNQIKASSLGDIGIVLIHHDAFEKEYYTGLFENFNIKYNFIHNKVKSRRFKHYFKEETRVDLEDVFEMRERNADYLRDTDQFFSDSHLFFEEDGFVGFADYLTIGEPYAESGFLPYAVAIHLTYESGEGEIRIRHFVSDSNDDYRDTPGKFQEAISKLVAFTNDLPFKTSAIAKFEGYHRQGHYPGLGIIKKLSILNHLELVEHLLEKQNAD